MKKKLFSLLLIFVIFLGCKEEIEYTLSPTSVSINATDTYDLKVLPASDNWTFNTDNKWIATVSTQGVITANRVGTTNIVVKNSDNNYLAKCKVTVLPNYSMYKDPYLTFGVSKSTVKSYEKRSLYSENTDNLIFNGENATLTNLVYSFESSKLTGVGSLVPTTYSSLMGSFLAERYIYVGESDDILIFITPDYKIVIGASVASIYYWMIIYMENTEEFPIPQSATMQIDNLLLNKLGTRASLLINKEFKNIKVQ